MRLKNYQTIKNARALTVTDIVVLTLAAIIAVAGILLIKPMGKGEYAYIYSGSTLVKVMPLDRDDVYNYSYGDGHNEITVKEGKVWVTAADCADKLCVNSAPVNISGGSIACLPHNLYIVVVGGEGVDDAV